MSKEIVAATGNRHKLREIRRILEPHGITVLGSRDVGGIPTVEETCDTFVGNASKKAYEVACAIGRTVLADDSGLEVFALNGRPGVLSARYAGNQAPDAKNVAKLLAEMTDVKERKARFVCVIALAGPTGVAGTAEGEVRGRIIAQPRGSNGFGYDPVFVPAGYSVTFAELEADEKNRISHRSAALQAVLPLLLDTI